VEFSFFSIFSPAIRSLPLSSSHINESDEALVRAYRSTGDNHWIGILLQRYTMLLLGVAMKYLRDKEQAQDAVQHIFLKALTHLPAGDILNFKGWIYVLMRNHCLQLLRDKVYHAGDEALSLVPAHETRIEDLILHDLSLAEMKAALKKLQPEQHTCVTLFYLRKRSYHQIMDETGFTFTQVKSFIQNGKRNLKIAIIKKLPDTDERP
jgi:RNA polymerase sigma-70 factor (ECF subfamily)